MEEKEILEIQNLSDDDLLLFHDKLVEHIDYLHGSILDANQQESEEISDEQQQS